MATLTRATLIHTKTSLIVAISRPVVWTTCTVGNYKEKINKCHTLFMAMLTVLSKLAIKVTVHPLLFLTTLQQCAILLHVCSFVIVISTSYYVAFTII